MITQPLLPDIRNSPTYRCTAALQGTAATALAGLYGAMRAMGKAQSELAQQRILCVGAGSAGMGVVSMIAEGEHYGCCIALFLVCVRDLYQHRSGSASCLSATA